MLQCFAVCQSFGAFLNLLLSKKKKKNCSKITECLKGLLFLSPTQLPNFSMYLISRYAAVLLCHIHFIKALHPFLVLHAAPDASICFNFLPHGIVFLFTCTLLKCPVYVWRHLSPSLFAFPFISVTDTLGNHEIIHSVSSRKSRNLSPFIGTNQFHWCIKTLNYSMYLVLNMSSGLRLIISID